MSLLKRGDKFTLSIFGEKYKCSFIDFGNNWETWKSYLTFIRALNIETHILIEMTGSFLDDDSLTPPPAKKCLFSEIDFLDVSDDFKPKKKYCVEKKTFDFSIFLLLEIEL